MLSYVRAHADSVFWLTVAISLDYYYAVPQTLIYSDQVVR